MPRFSVANLLLLLCSSAVALAVYRESYSDWGLAALAFVAIWVTAGLIQQARHLPNTAVASASHANWQRLAIFWRWALAVIIPVLLFAYLSEDYLIDPFFPEHYAALFLISFDSSLSIAITAAVAPRFQLNSRSSLLFFYHCICCLFAVISMALFLTIFHTLMLFYYHTGTRGIIASHAQYVLGNWVATDYPTIDYEGTRSFAFCTAAAGCVVLSSCAALLRYGRLATFLRNYGRLFSLHACLFVASGIAICLAILHHRFAHTLNQDLLSSIFYGWRYLNPIQYALGIMLALGMWYALSMTLATTRVKGQTENAEYTRRYHHESRLLLSLLPLPMIYGILWTVFNSDNPVEIWSNWPQSSNEWIARLRRLEDWAYEPEFAFSAALAFVPIMAITTRPVKQKLTPEIDARILPAVTVFSLTCVLLGPWLFYWSVFWGFEIWASQ